MVETHSGSCFCGAVAIEVTGLPEEMGYCHCNSCRSYSGAPLVAFTLWKRENVRVTKGEDLLGRFKKTDFSDRRYCMRCGGHLMVDHPTLGFTDVYASIVPTMPFEPTVHLHYAEAVLPIEDGLPKLKDFPAEAGGSGEAVAEQYPLSLRRWRDRSPDNSSRYATASFSVPRRGSRPCGS